jgi:hypothetical protein
MVAVSGGRILALSTPAGKRGWWHEAWSSHEPWERTLVTAYDCPRISPEFLEEERRNLPHLWFASEYLCQFVELDDAVFSYDLVMGATADVPLLFGGHF